MKTKDLPPFAPSLTETMRDIGYSLETAVADIIDNSIAAGASKIDILFDFEDHEPTLAIIDNGHGMDTGELEASMRHGCINPRESRESNDLGRFGLGMKTASFSQCRKFSVLSRKNGCLSGAIWDLDYIEKTKGWSLQCLEQEDFKCIPYIDKLSETGTMVLWEKLDRLSEGNTETVIRDIGYEKIETVEHHLALVFHRFLKGGDLKRKIDICINGMDVKGFDPFCLKNNATQILQEEIVRINGEEIKITPYILPHHSKLTHGELRFYKERSEFVSNQGVYVYRSGRLMSWGDWFRIIPKSEATKLARVKIDFPNNLDEAWTIDIKKARAHPPHQVKKVIQRIIPQITDTGKRVYRGRGKRLYSGDTLPLWKRTVERSGICYEIDVGHRLFASLLKNMDEQQKNNFAELMSHLSKSLPIEMIYSDYSVKPKEVEAVYDAENEEVTGRLRSLLGLLGGSGSVDKETFLSIIFSQKYFIDKEPVIQAFLKENYYE